MSTLELEGLDAQVVLVQQLEAARKAIKQPQVDFSGRLTSATVADTMKGSSTLSLAILDPEHELLDSGFFDARADGKLDPLELNFPVGSDNWWRMSSVDVNADHQIVMTLMERIAVEMQRKKGPLKTSRGKKTRAEFLQMLVAKSDKDAVFISKELHERQKPKKDPKTKVTGKDRKATKSGGLHANSDLKINTRPAKKPQLTQAEIALDVATELHAPSKAVEAMVCAGIGESEFKCVVNSLGYGGVFQGQVNTGGHYFSKDDTAAQAECFLKGGKGFGGGGAIHQANTYRDKSPGMIAADVEVSYPNSYLPTAAAAEHHYQQHIDEAQAIIEAYGGGGFGGSTYHAQYNFAVGDQSNPHESFWDAANRLADEVRWAFFIDGQHVYFDNEQTLIGQKPAAVINRIDPQVVDWHATWDERQIATEMTLALICDPFEFRAGEVLQLIGFGPLSTGSAATPKRPGFWLIDSMNREIGTLATEFTLRQPQNPKSEPRSELRESRDSGVTKSDLIDAIKKISRSTPGYDHYPPSESHARTFTQMRPSQEFDCSSSTSYALWLADMMPGDRPQVASWFASTWGEAGRGQTFTVWASDGHVFMQSEGKDSWRFDTGGPGGGSGAKFRPEKRSTAGFTPRHWKGQ